MRKKRFLILVAAVILTLSALPFSLKAQDARYLRLQEETEELFSEFSTLAKAGDNASAIVPLEKLISMYDTISLYKDPSLGLPKRMFDEQKAVFQYNLACLYALLGKRKLALEALTDCVDNGFNDYGTMAWDEDLAVLKKDRKFLSLLDVVKERQPLEVLKKTNGYRKEAKGVIPEFEYQPMEHVNLKRVRDYFQLDTIKGRDNELEHIINLMHFIHDNMRHDGSSMTVSEYDAIDLFNYCKATGRGVNCRMLSLALADVYLSMGYKARVVTCLPLDPEDPDCHVINAVWSRTLQKWVWMDATNDAWVMDENGTLLGIAEVRERLIDGRPLVLCETANWNHESPQTKEYYLENYMAKNLYYQVCKRRSFFNQESIYRYVDNEDIRLIPEGFENGNYQSALTTTDPELFWARPE